MREGGLSPDLLMSMVAIVGSPCVLPKVNNHDPNIAIATGRSAREKGVSG